MLEKNREYQKAYATPRLVIMMISDPSFVGILQGVCSFVQISDLDLRGCMYEKVMC
jgi:hypothetical protein